ncbi:MAG TPA: sigma-54 dependent transcriptional regulator [Pyrinomonadaceae bacterium]|nr:sigma-54 dependent transcriptional regulator [Pyrinomonadaceae bacterium]
MQLGHESSNQLEPTMEHQRIHAVELHGGRVENKHARLMQLDHMICGQSKVMSDLKKSILRAAECSSTVLIIGESGTGKELIARSIHELGERRREPFQAINCGALTESLLESELFGHVKGAFTGATSYKKGMFESAGQGTIFLDEFGEMSSSMQVRLLRVLQERKVRPVGSEDSREIVFNARVVVATNRDLRRDVAEGRFRQDLYYRVNVLPIRSPALRDRLDDFPLLIDVLLNRIVESGKLARTIRFDSEAVSVLQSYAWPGNVRELENVIERLAINAPRTYVVSSAEVSLDLEVNGSAQYAEHREIILASRLRCLTNSGVSVRHLSKRQELDVYIQELGRVGGDVTKAARRLGIKRTTLHMRIKRLEKTLSGQHRLNETPPLHIGDCLARLRDLSRHGETGDFL